MAGLHQPDFSNSAPLCTATVVQVLTKRVRANATLTQLLYLLEKRKTIPTHPAMKDELAATTTVSAKLSGWTESTEKNDASQQEHQRTFLAMIKRKHATLKATVMLDMVQYPAIRPRWNLTGGEEGWGEKRGSALALYSGTNPLYDSTLGQLERSINAATTSLVMENVEETYDWILAHQLHTIVVEWDRVQKVEEEGGSADVAVGMRSKKGRDRVSQIE
jgi:hypothetical protein